MERLTEYHCGVAVIKDKSKLKDAMQKLAHYEDLEEQGCKVGDVVWTKYGYSFEVEKVEIIKGGKIFRCGNQGTSDYMAFYEYEIGTDVFLTKEEAEAKLKEMESKQECQQ